MLTINFRQSAAAGLLAAALVASSHSTASADWTITSSCVGGWTMSNCVVNKRNFPRDPHIREVRNADAWRSGDNVQEAQESVARDRKWLAFCKPVVYADRFGVHRYHYAKPGCEYGRSE